MSWCQVRTAFLLDENFPALTDGVADDWIWDAMNVETLPTGWTFSETDHSGAAGYVLVFEMEHAPRQMEFTAVEAVLQMMEKKYAK